MRGPRRAASAGERRVLCPSDCTSFLRGCFRTTHMRLGPLDVGQRHNSATLRTLLCTHSSAPFVSGDFLCTHIFRSQLRLGAADPRGRTLVGENDRNTRVFTFRTKTLQTMRTRAMEALKPKNCFSLKNAGIWERKTRHFGGRYTVSILPGSLRRDVCHSDFYIDGRAADMQPKQAKSSDAI